MAESAHTTAEPERAKQPANPAPAAEGAPQLAVEAHPLSAAAGDGGAPNDTTTRHAALLGDPRLLQRTSPTQRARLVQHMQRGYGNHHVAQVMAQRQAARELVAPPPANLVVAPPVSDPHSAPAEQTVAAAHDEPLQRAEAPIQRGMLDSINPLNAAKDAALNKAAEWAANIPGYTMLTLVLGKNPINGKAVERNATNVCRAVLGLLPGGEQLFKSLEEAGVLEKAFAWFSDQFNQLGITFETIKGLFKQAWDAIDLSDFLPPTKAWDKVKGIFGEPIKKLIDFGKSALEKVGEFIFEGVLAQLGGGPVMGLLRKAGDAFKAIVKDPIGFVANLLNGVKQGFLNFGKHILDHLKSGLVKWLFGELASGGITLPKSFDLKGILTLAMQLLGMTWNNVRAQAVKLLGEKAVGRLESGVEKGFKLFTIIRDEGLGGLWEYIKEQLGNLKDMVMDGIKDMVISQVVQAGIQWLIGVLGGPAGAIIKAIQTIYNVVMWFYNNASRIAELITAIGDSISAIASGAVGQAAKFIEDALGRSVPILLGLLANLLGLGNLSQKIKAIIEKVQQPINKAIGWVLGKAKGFVSKVMGKVKGAFGKKDEKVQDKDGHDVKAKVRSTLVTQLKGKVAGKAELDSVLNSVYTKYKPEGLKKLDVVESGGKLGQFDIVATASPPEKAATVQAILGVRLDDLDLKPRKTSLNAAINGEPIGRFESEPGGGPHAEEILLTTLRQNWNLYVGKYGPGQHVLSINLTRSPCGEDKHNCSKQLQDFAAERNIQLDIKVMTIYGGKEAAGIPSKLGLEKLAASGAKITVWNVLDELKQWGVEPSEIIEDKVVLAKLEARIKETQEDLDKINASKAG